MSQLAEAVEQFAVQLDRLRKAISRVDARLEAIEPAIARIDAKLVRLDQVVATVTPRPSTAEMRLVREAPPRTPSADLRGAALKREPRVRRPRRTADADADDPRNRSTGTEPS